MDRRWFLTRSLAQLSAVLGTMVGASPRAGAAAAKAKKESEAEREGKKVSLPKALLAARCPVTGDRVSADAALDYFGGKVYFSSRDCIRKFKSNRAEYEAKARAQLVVTGQFTQVRCPVDGEPLVPAIKTKIGGVEVRFCSAECAKKIRRASADERGELVFVKGFSNAFAAKQEATLARRSATEPDEDRWECTVCGHVHRGSSPPLRCPQCGANSDAFVRKS